MMTGKTVAGLRATILVVRGRVWRLLSLAMVLAGLVLASAGTGSASAAENPFCVPGLAAKNCNGPEGVGSDFETGHVYVVDKGDNLLKAYEPDGTFIGSIGAGQLTNPSWAEVDNDSSSASKGDVWVTTEEGAGSAGLIKKFEPNGTLIAADSISSASEGKGGTGPCEFAADDPIAVGPEGRVYVADIYEKGPGAPLKNIFISRLIIFDSTGHCLQELQLGESEVSVGQRRAVESLAVDSTGHVYLVESNGKLLKYSPAGVREDELDSQFETRGLAVDEADDLFAKQRGETKTALIHFFSEYSPTGTPIRRYDYEIRPELAVPDLATYRENPTSLHLYASEKSGGVRDRPLPAPGPVVVPQLCRVQGQPGSTRATLFAEVNPEGKATEVWFEFKAAGGFEQTAKETLPADFELHEVGATIKAEGLLPETEYHCRVAAENADNTGSPALGEEGTFTTKEGFEFGPAWSAEVGETAARIFVEGNPLGTEATGQIEYVDDAKYQASKFAEALRAPTPELVFCTSLEAAEGSCEQMVSRSAVLGDLTPGTLYHYRLRARNGTPPEGIVCPHRAVECPEFEHTFRTYASAAAPADGRRYELVSPADKNSGEVAVPFNSGGLNPEDRSIRIQAAAGSGEAVTYTSWSSFGVPEGSSGTNQYLSRRTPAGWETQNISPYGFLANALYPYYLGFTPDLRYGVFKTTEPALTPDCRVGSEDIYLRDDEGGPFRCLSPQDPEGPESQCLVYAGRSEGPGSIFIAGKPEGGESYTYGLYEETLAGGFNRVSVLPDGSPAPATQGTAYGPGGNSFAGSEGCQVTRTRLASAISADGQEAFWTYVPERAALEASRLYVRIGGSETLQLDRHQSGVGSESGNGVFWGASKDGTVAYFTDAERLVSGAHAEAGEPDLYRWQLGAKNPLTDLTKGAVSGDVKGVVGISADGSDIYFVAGAALTGEEDDEAGEKAKEGADNLYLYHEGSLTFVASLSSEDTGDWAANPRLLSARTTPDGGRLAFMSTEAEALAGYDNTIATGEHCQYSPAASGAAGLAGSPLCAQLFVYDAETGKIDCASCNPSGSRPLGPTIVPGWTNPSEGPRFLSDDGSRAFFATFDALLPADENEKLDVYEFERPGRGSCEESSPNFDAASDGCHFLVSSGKSGDESYLVDASADGRDVFFSTRQALTGWDTNENYDVYDYREGGGFPEPPAAAAPCEGEACKSASQSPPSLSAPPDVVGPGNPRPRSVKCRKGLVRKHGKCVRPRHKHKKHHHTRQKGKPKNRRGAGR